ncbi:SapC family protein [Aliiglaciecola sp. CAU 1673]|uniref:SapC family protein n=1 Tax=Aliiglaciecola sp. CAU 1673 TaxID=3032595 RepID=UPI0023DCBA89|nr:SapC family protein [Aliiglaciecola sp. CAU 1673]MDF2179867.1 SapC family protein [Aliiglaciecola sp. CAU 1673]
MTSHKPKIIPLDAQLHAHLRVERTPRYIDFAEDQLIPVQLREFVAIACEFPIIFVKHQETGRFRSVALMGLKQGENLYCQNGHWPGHYVPQALRNPPFSFSRAQENDDQLILCIDVQHPSVSAHSGEALFTEEGEQSDYLQKRANNMLSYVTDSQITEHFITFLLDNDLLVSRALQLQMPDNEMLQLNGIYVVDEKRLAALPSNKIEELHTRGLLAPIYAQLISMQQIQRLSAKYQQLHQDEF